MIELVQNIASIAWLALAIFCFVHLIKWNKRLSELFGELEQDVEELSEMKRQIKEMED